MYSRKDKAKSNTKKKHYKRNNKNKILRKTLKHNKNLRCAPEQECLPFALIIFGYWQGRPLLVNGR